MATTIPLSARPASWTVACDRCGECLSVGDTRDAGSWTDTHQCAGDHPVPVSGAGTPGTHAGPATRDGDGWRLIHLRAETHDAIVLEGGGTACTRVPRRRTRRARLSVVPAAWPPRRGGVALTTVSGLQRLLVRTQLRVERLLAPSGPCRGRASATLVEVAEDLLDAGELLLGLHAEVRVLEVAAEGAGS